jgi:hypothetical protein
LSHIFSSKVTDDLQCTTSAPIFMNFLFFLKKTLQIVRQKSYSHCLLTFVLNVNTLKFSQQWVLSMKSCILGDMKLCSPLKLNRQLC